MTVLFLENSKGKRKTINLRVPVLFRGTSGDGLSDSRIFPCDAVYEQTILKLFL